MKRSKWLRLCIGLVVFVCINVVLGLATNVPTHLTEDDKLVFEEMYGRYKSARRNMSPGSEIALISEMQKDVLKRVPFGPGIPAYSSREPADVLHRDSGLCYDRSRLFDKLFQWAGFETRHVYILWMPVIGSRYTLPLWVTFLVPGSDSHAVTEVKTSGGWLVVESNVAWLSVTRQGQIVDADHIWQRRDEFEYIPEYLKKPFWSIRGLYSRKGHLYKPYFPYPQFNWSDFFHHLAE